MGLLEMTLLPTYLDTNNNNNNESEDITYNDDENDSQSNECTITNPFYISFCYDKVVNLLVNHTDTRIVDPKDLQQMKQKQVV